MERLHKLGHGLVPWSRTADPGLVQHHHKGVNALTADNAGTAQFQTSPMQNTNDYLNSKNTERFKAQAASPKPQAPSLSRKLKKYSRK